MNAFEIAIYLGLATQVATAAWHVAVLVVLIIIARRLGRN